MPLPTKVEEVDLGVTMLDDELDAGDVNADAAGIEANAAAGVSVLLETKTKENRLACLLFDFDIPYLLIVLWTHMGLQICLGNMYMCLPM